MLSVYECLCSSCVYLSSQCRSNKGGWPILYALVSKSASSFVPWMNLYCLVLCFYVLSIPSTSNQSVHMKVQYYWFMNLRNRKSSYPIKSNLHFPTANIIEQYHLPLMNSRGPSYMDWNSRWSTDSDYWLIVLTKNYNWEMICFIYFVRWVLIKVLDCCF